jgi:hypothetical protein
MFLHEPVDEPPGYADFSGNERQILGREPAGIGNLGIIDTDFAPAYQP